MKPGSNRLRIVGIGHEIAAARVVLRAVSTYTRKGVSEARRLAAL
jgi:hypothetical protein